MAVVRHTPPCGHLRDMYEQYCCARKKITILFESLSLKPESVYTDNTVANEYYLLEAIFSTPFDLAYEDKTGKRYHPESDGLLRELFIYVEADH